MSTPSRAQLDALISRIANGFSAVELVHTPHDYWPYPPYGRPTRPTNLQDQGLASFPEQPSNLKISVLDSSFNPPTRAHLALASLPIPSRNTHDKAIVRDFDARLLLLSVRNADKFLKPTDATYIQRLEMMMCLSREIRPVLLQQPEVLSSDYMNSDDPSSGNVAVAIIDEPTFVGKARALSKFLHERTTSIARQATSMESPIPSTAPSEGFALARLDLTFIVGIDTLERILSPRYYPSPDEMRRYLKQFMASTQLLCCRRIVPGQISDAQTQREKEVLALAREYLDLSKLSIVDIDEELEAFSSSEVRQRICEGDTMGWRKMVTPSTAEYIGLEGLYFPKAEAVS